METLYNGIVLPDPWPPRRNVLPADPVPPPYLQSPPAVIPIDLGRQLFVDDFLVEHTDLMRTFHQPVPHPGNPVVKADQPWECVGNRHAMPFSDGVWFDPSDGLFKMWYYGGGGSDNTGFLKPATCLATSRDGLYWEKPRLDRVPWQDQPRTNIVLLGWRDSSTIWLDHESTDPRARFKMMLYHDERIHLYRSADGLRWEYVSAAAAAGDRSTFFHNPFRRRWVFSIKCPGNRWDAQRKVTERIRAYWEGQDFFGFSPTCHPPVPSAQPTGEAAGRQPDESVLWTGADSGDPRCPELDVVPELYNLDAVAYESLMLGFFAIWQGDYRHTPSDTPLARECLATGRPKVNEVFIGFSRDGFHWHRPDRQPFLPRGEASGGWNWGNVQSVGGGCLVVGDHLFFYYSARAGKGLPGCPTHDGGGSTGLAILRRDGFASMDAGAAGGELVTRPVRFAGTHLFVNADCAAGELRVEMLDEHGRVIAPFTAAGCEPVRADGTRQPITWRGAGDLGALGGRTVRLRFHLRTGRLFAFWIAADATGRSGGYTAAGGPGLQAGRDG